MPNLKKCRLPETRRTSRKDMGPEAMGFPAESNREYCCLSHSSCAGGNDPCLGRHTLFAARHVFLLYYSLQVMKKYDEDVTNIKK